MAAPGVRTERKGHVCPPSTATHPMDRWESLFVYAFILKFTNLKGKIQGFETPMDLEEALMSREPNDILTKILIRFILNLKPQTRNLNTDQISTTVSGVLAEYFKTNERAIFWDDNLKANVDPFEGMDCGFFAADWDLKLKILRQLVELQLTHSLEIKATIDRAWGVVHNKHKKEKGVGAAGSSATASSELDRQFLGFQPYGYDAKRARYWVVDNSPRIYTTTNPWRLSSSFKAISTTREEYAAVIENLKSTIPPLKKGQRRSKSDVLQLSLIEDLENRVETIDQELARVAKVRKKLEQTRILMAQAELRQTRTRRQAQKPDYVYYNQESEDEEYQFQDDGEFEDDEESEEKGNKRTSAPTRRSARTAVLNANGKREGSSESSWGGWKGERRSTRLGFQDPFDERPPKRARTEESTTSAGESLDAISITNGQVEASNDGKSSAKVKVKATGAAALKPNEVAMEQIAGKKRSKFWVYAVEPTVAPESEGDTKSVEMDVESGERPADVNGHGLATDGET
ncbi:hypothetical protein Agabi119p4_245 [Agaricus bisporus var. burnettii]|uniref:WHIM1 domain-containing protein n=1 Tax=Agaricus bisporus var. burnettii TaxID=192524 RepID=A0A8H7FA51_AGABI|nr:hypothetical protein Agabi119p4_245 [Agaricus bisporus var. burnettii]